MKWWPKCGILSKICSLIFHLPLCVLQLSIFWAINFVSRQDLKVTCSVSLTDLQFNEDSSDTSWFLSKKEKYQKRYLIAYVIFFQKILSQLDRVAIWCRIPACTGKSFSYYKSANVSTRKMSGNVCAAKLQLHFNCCFIF